ncbi:methylmalonyl Co-A mutase-associated GTPase MeaB [Pollutibacter soli]|uniref:methylmalonyl Co-A mutase-associated GTPase MeaB n=1 Tax=Pollutibacter soli TaxID=3034157 RepID=UPI003013EC08
MHELLLEKAITGDRKSIARCISLIENESEGYEELLHALPELKEQHVIGVTGPPGAGKSTLVDGMIKQWVDKKKKVAVICVDPSSAFHQGALLGDRIRMSNWFDNENVYIRSLATRGSLGGLNAAVLEILLLLNACPFDLVIIETVGVGQSEVDIAKLADVTVVVLVPEGGDEIQTMKAGLMEIADIFVINKSDRPGADLLMKNLMEMSAPVFSRKEERVAVVKTIASQQEGIAELVKEIEVILEKPVDHQKKAELYASRAWQLIQKRRMRDLSYGKLVEDVRERMKGGGWRFYSWVDSFAPGRD